MVCLALGVLALGLASSPREGAKDEPGADVPLPWEYDADAVAEYWARRWVQSFKYIEALICVKLSNCYIVCFFFFLDVLSCKLSGAGQCLEIHHATLWTTPGCL